MIRLPLNNAAPDESLEHKSNDDPSLAGLKHSLLAAQHAATLPHNLALLEIERQHRLAWYHSHFNPNQPRVPAGNADGGQWTSAGAHAAGDAASGSDARSVSFSRAEGELDSGNGMPPIQHVATEVDVERAWTKFSSPSIRSGGDRGQLAWHKDC
jgi:hypothetical protein